MGDSRRSHRKRRVTSQFRGGYQNKALHIVLFISLICLLIAHFNFNKLYLLFIVGLLGFSFAMAYLIVAMLEPFLPTRLVNHRLWTGEGLGGKGMAGLIAGILAIAIMAGIPYLLMKMGVDYIK